MVTPIRKSNVIPLKRPGKTTPNVPLPKAKPAPDPKPQAARGDDDLMSKEFPTPVSTVAVPARENKGPKPVINPSS